ncbi:glycosyltransferase family 2 protein [Aquabacter sp. L1I39]|uniref:glycosyltransferase family 2 protein n=1 Tax=Aquabacter sp. L1I39 TaxID=2820278 RepID=UPI001AD975E6|nr:glycosyltransferase family 2 protein [Aquabacter sp. L1I39]QTL03673.1 glycosyltransferase family 2 protein [Aquabacter sp. L1I39]
MRYRRYRSAHVGDFQDIAPPAKDLRLTFVTILDSANTRAEVRGAYDALQGQTDPEWEWVVTATRDAPGDLIAWVRTLLTNAPHCRVVAGAPANEGPVARALSGIAGGLVAELPLSGAPTRDAVAMIRATFAEHVACEIVYTDEEMIDGRGQPEGGLFKPAFNRHLLRSTDYIGHIVAARANTLRRAPRRWLDGGRHMLRLAVIDTLPPSAIRHIPRVAFSRRGPCHTAPGALELAAASRILGVQVTDTPDGFLKAHYPVPQPEPLVSIVIPTRDRADLMGMALRSLTTRTDYKNFEIIIVDNGSVEEKTFALFEEVRETWPRTTIIRDEGDFNYPRICNAGVAAAQGSILCLLNNDIEVVDGSWLREMVAVSALPRTGVVGAKLLFPDHSIQHAGVIVGLFRYAAHWFSHASEHAPGPFGRLVNRTNVSAVTGACLVITRKCWDEVGPLDAVRFAEDCNDIDLCLKARHAGYEVVWTPFACLIHHESASRGRRRGKAHRNRLKAQRQRMEAMWHTSTLVDPHYNPNLSRTSLHAALASAPQGPRQSRTDAIPAPD